MYEAGFPRRFRRLRGLARDPRVSLTQGEALLASLLDAPRLTPVGSRALDGGSPHHRDFAYVLGVSEHAADPGALTRRARSLGLFDAHFVPLGSATEQLSPSGEGDSWWALYCALLLGGYEPPSRSLDVFSFGSSPEMAARLAHLVLKGKKRWTSSSVEALHALGVNPPHAGLLSIVTDGFGLPLCLIETQEVRTVAFRDVGADVAAGEGEGDLSLEDFRESHIRYFTNEAARLGLTFGEESRVLNERFQVVHMFGTVP